MKTDALKCPFCHAPTESPKTAGQYWACVKCGGVSEVWPKYLVAGVMLRPHTRPLVIRRKADLVRFKTVRHAV